MPLELFSETPLPGKLPKEMQKAVEELKKSSDKQACLRNAYAMLVEKYRGHRFRTYLQLFDVLESDIEALWRKNGFMHCTNINYVLRVLLVKSGYFQEQDIRLKWTQIWYVSPHQYLQAKVDGKWIDIDIWGHAYGIKFGDKAQGFN